MIESGHYPVGAEYSSDAPWNKETVSEREFEVTVSQTLSRSVKIVTDDYSLEGYQDEDGYHDYADTSNTNWKEAYQNADFKIQDLLAALKEYVKSDLAMSGEHTNKGKYLKKLLAACDGWVEDEYEVIEN